jgi:hypothetical protein
VKIEFKNQTDHSDNADEQESLKGLIFPDIPFLERMGNTHISSTVV